MYLPTELCTHDAAPPPPYEERERESTEGNPPGRHSHGTPEPKFNLQFRKCPLLLDSLMSCHSSNTRACVYVRRDNRSSDPWPFVSYTTCPCVIRAYTYTAPRHATRSAVWSRATRAPALHIRYSFSSPYLALSVREASGGESRREVSTKFAVWESDCERTFRVLKTQFHIYFGLKVTQQNFGEARWREKKNYSAMRKTFCRDSERHANVAKASLLGSLRSLIETGFPSTLISSQILIFK